MKMIIIQFTYKERISFVRLLANNTSVSDLEEILRKKFNIPDEYYLKRSNYKGPPSYPFVHDGDEFVFVDRTDLIDFRTIAVLYGCPSAKDTFGNVPSCMLNTFDGFILNKI